MRVESSIAADCALGPPTKLSFGEATTEIIRSRRIGVRELARMVGASPSHMSRVLRPADGKRASVALIERVGAVLDLPPGFFLETRRAALIGELVLDPDLVDELYARRPSHVAEARVELNVGPTGATPRGARDHVEGAS